MIAFLDRLCNALLARDADEIRRLLRHPLVHALPRRVKAEALAIARTGANGHRAPIETLRLYHQTAHLLGRLSDPAARATAPAPAGSGAQIELALDAVA